MPINTPPADGNCCYAASRAICLVIQQPFSSSGGPIPGLSDVFSVTENSMILPITQKYVTSVLI